MEACAKPEAILNCAGEPRNGSGKRPAKPHPIAGLRLCWRRNGWFGRLYDPRLPGHDVEGGPAREAGVDFDRVRVAVVNKSSRFNGRRREVDVFAGSDELENLRMGGNAEADSRRGYAGQIARGLDRQLARDVTI